MKAVPAKRKPESASLRHALHGLALPASVLRALQKRGIYCTPAVSLEHQHLAKRYVLRGVESGGAVPDMGRACALSLATAHQILMKIFFLYRTAMGRMVLRP
jgi:hypothetical protein